MIFTIIVKYYSLVNYFPYVTCVSSKELIIFSSHINSSFCYSDDGIMDISYPGRFVPKTIRTQVGRFVASGLDVSFLTSGRFVPIGWTFRTQGLDVRAQCFFF